MMRKRKVVSRSKRFSISTWAAAGVPIFTMMDGISRRASTDTEGSPRWSRNAPTMVSPNSPKALAEWERNIAMGQPVEQIGNEPPLAQLAHRTDSLPRYPGQDRRAGSKAGDQSSPGARPASGPPPPDAAGALVTAPRRWR